MASPLSRFSGPKIVVANCNPDTDRKWKKQPLELDVKFHASALDNIRLLWPRWPSQPIQNRLSVVGAW